MLVTRCIEADEAIAAAYVIGSALTEIVTNNAVAVVPTPVAIGFTLELDPRPFVVAVMFAARGDQTNTLVRADGAYCVADFLRFGLLSVLLIPVIQPF